MRLTAIVENRVQKKHLWAEDGLSILFEADGDTPLRALYDCGRSGTVAAHNLDVMGIRCDSIGHVILSHGHQGHMGGLVGMPPLGQCPVLMYHPSIRHQKAKRDGQNVQYQKMPFGPGCASERMKLDPLTESRVLGPGLFLSGQIPADVKPGKPSDARFLVDRGHGLIMDDFEEELALGVETSHGLVVITACAHRGVMSTVRHLLQLRPGMSLAGVVGGFHLRDNVSATRRLIRELRPLNPTIVAPCHCTGWGSIAMLAGAFPEAFRSFSVGDAIEL